MSDFRTERVKNALDNRKLNLSTKCPTPGGKGKYSSLIWGLYQNNPRLTVYTNDSNDTKDNGRITANLDLPNFFAFLNLLEEVAKTEGVVRYKIENKNFTFYNKQRSDTPVVVSELWLGKDEEGVVWISVVAKDRPKIKFTFGEGEWHHYYNGDGTPVEKSKFSKIYALAYVELLRNMLPTLAIDNFVEPVKKDFKGKGNNGGGNNRSNSNDSDISDDLPF